MDTRQIAANATYEYQSVGLSLLPTTQPPSFGPFGPFGRFHQEPTTNVNNSNKYVNKCVCVVVWCYPIDCD